MRVAFLDGAIYLVPGAAESLRAHGIEPLAIDGPQTVLRTLTGFPEAWDAVVYPVSTRWQHALDFVRSMRRVREFTGTQATTPVLVLSTTAQHPTTIDLFRRTSGTRFSVVVPPDDLAYLLKSMREEMLVAKRQNQKLHLRLVHAGNPAGIGCIRDEQLSAVYASFQPGKEAQVKESPSVLHFLNLLAMNHWRFRTASEVVQLMRQSPFYSSYLTSATVVAISSVKTYIARSEAALSHTWRRWAGVDVPPVLIAREARGGKVVAYRLMATCEIDHV